MWVLLDLDELGVATGSTVFRWFVGVIDEIRVRLDRPRTDGLAILTDIQFWCIGYVCHLFSPLYLETEIARDGYETRHIEESHADHHDCDRHRRRVDVCPGVCIK